MYQVLYGNEAGFESSPDLTTINQARRYAESCMKQQGVNEAVIIAPDPTKEGGNPIEYYGPHGHFSL